MVSSARSTTSEQTWQSIKKLKQGCHGASTHIIVRPSAPQGYQCDKAPIVIKQKVIISRFACRESIQMPMKQAELDRANKGRCTLYILASTRVVEKNNALRNEPIYLEVPMFFQSPQS